MSCGGRAVNHRQMFIINCTKISTIYNVIHVLERKRVENILGLR